jgi:hypothetical protein
MSTHLHIEQSPELIKAINEGFTIAYVFIDGFLHVESDPGKNYPIKDVCKEPKPCLESNTVVYRITAPDGCRGYAVSDWEEDP